jgi:hypothetical protein
MPVSRNWRFLSLRHQRLDGIEETDELALPVALHIAADDGPTEDVEAVELDDYPTGLMSVRAKSSPLNSSGSSVSFASGYAKQSPKFSFA